MNSKRRNRKEEQQIIIKNITIPKSNKLSSYLIGFGTLLILSFNAYIFYLSSFPKTDLLIQSVQIEVDHEAKRDSTLLNEFYLEIRVYNNGKKSSSIKSFEINITDQDSPNTITRSHNIYFPSYINPGQLKQYILKLYTIKLYFIDNDTLFSEYKLPYTMSYKQWRKEVEPLNKFKIPTFALQLKKPIKVNLSIDAIDKKYFHEVEINTVNFQNIKTFYNLSKTTVI